MKPVAALIISALLASGAGAAPLDLDTLSCKKYESEVLPAAASNPLADPINTVMWLLGYSVAKSGGHVMYPEALAPFGFALDNECKSNPDEMLLTALGIVKPQATHPMDLTDVPCSAFALRHRGLMQNDPDSATTIMMWLFGFAAAKGGHTVLDADRIKAFERGLLEECARRPDAALFEALKDLPLLPPRAKPARVAPRAG